MEFRMWRRRPILKTVWMNVELERKATAAHWKKLVPQSQSGLEDRLNHSDTLALKGGALLGARFHASRSGEPLASSASRVG